MDARDWHLDTVPDPLTGELVILVAILPRVPYACQFCIGYPCECGTAGEGC